MRFLRLLLFIAITCAAPAMSFAADATATNNCHPITDDERAQLKEADVDVPANGQFCDKDKELLNGSCPETPYPYLESKKNNGGVDVAHLKPAFACQLYRFLKASDSAGMNIRITSGYRSVAKQADLYRACAAPCRTVAPPGRSRHNFGVAVDLTFDGVWPNSPSGNGNTASCIQKLRSCRWAHDDSGTYGLRWPMVFESWHIEPGNGGGGSLTADSNYWSTDSGTAYGGGDLAPVQNAPYYCLVSTAPIQTYLMQFPPGPGSGCLNAQTSSQMPYSSSPLMQPARATWPSATGTAATNPVTNPTTPTCNPSYSCTNGVMYYKTTQCTTQVYQVCSSSCNGNSCATATSSTNTIGNAFSTTSSVNNTTTNVNADTSAATPTQSVSEILGAMANPFSATTIGTSSSIAFALNPETGDVQSLGADGAAIASASSSPGVGVISSVQPASGQQTFTSGDLSQSGVSAGFQNKQTALAQILEGMEQALLWALSALTPFGGGTRR